MKAEIIVDGWLFSVVKIRKNTLLLSKNDSLYRMDKHSKKLEKIPLRTTIP